MEEVQPADAPVASATPIRICVLGSEAAGKTCFLGGLAILSEPNRDSHIHVIGAEADTVATNGSPSQQFLNEVAATLRAGDWPPPTTLTREIELDIRFRDRLFKFDVIDYPGESFREALNQLDESRQQALLDHMIKADFLLLMLDPVSDLPDASSLDTEQRQRVHERQNAHIAGIRKIYDDAQATRRKLPHIGLVITKADAHPELTDPEKFVTQRGPNLLARIKSWGVETKCFATSAVGTINDGRPAKELSPTGYTEVFDWVVQTTRKKRFNRFARRYLIPAALVIFTASLILFLQTNRATQLAANSTQPLDQRIRAANGAWIATPGLLKNIDALAADQLGQMRERFSNLRSTEELAQLTSDFQLLKTLRRTSRSHQITEFGTLLEEGDRKLRLLRIRSMDAADPELLLLTQTFINDYPAAEEAGEVAGIIDRIRDLKDATDREKVRRVTVQKGDLDSLNRKAEAIMEYVIKHRSAPESTNMERAAAVARRLASTNPLTIRVTGAGTFIKSRKWELRVFVGDMDQPVAKYPTDGKVRRATWDRPLKITTWKPGTRIRFEIEEFRLLNEIVAELEATDLLSIRTLAQNALIPIRDDFGSEYIEGGYFRVVSELEGFTRDDWKLLEFYVYPGKKW
ncbi:MAG: hypothetical protein ACI9UA_001211 [Pseudoalteromonas tetraodonis]|jgi:hypothetical protein